MNDPEDDVLTRDADALQAVFKATVHQIKLDEARTTKANKVSLQAALRSAGVYACREVRRWECRAGTALAKRKRSYAKAPHGIDNNGDTWEVESAEGNTLVLRKLRQTQVSDKNNE